MKKSENNNNVPLNEGSLNRIWSYINEYDAAAITAYRNSDINCVHGDNSGIKYSKRDNQDRNRELRASLLSNNYDVITISGLYIEGFGSDTTKEVKETTYLVINRKNDTNFNNKIAKLGEYFCQDSVLIIPKGGSDAYLLGTNNSDFPGFGRQHKVGNFKPKGEGMFMSKKDNASFTFENWDNNNVMGKWMIHLLAENANKFLSK